MAGTADANCLQGYSMSYNIMLSNKKLRVPGVSVGLGGSYCLETGWSSICLWEVVSGSKTPLGVFPLFFTFLFPLTKLSLSGPMHFLAFPVLSHVSHCYRGGGGMSEQGAVRYLAAVWG